jgi:sporulation protein YlmC with PRC-barrel domain
MKGTKIMSTDGRDLGTMIDLYFDELTGEIEGYEVSGGMFADAYSGRSFVPAPETLKIGKDVAFVPSETADMMQEHVGGIKASMQTAGEKMRETADATGDRLQVTGQAATRTVTNAIIDPQEQKAFALRKIAIATVETQDGVPIVLVGQEITQSTINTAQDYGLLDCLYRSAGGSVAEQIGERVNNTAAGFSVDRAQGRRVAKTVYTSDGYIVAATGQIVTSQVIERAKTHHQEPALLESVGLSTGDAVKGQAHITGAQIKEKTLDASEQIRTGAKGLWEQEELRAPDRNPTPPPSVVLHDSESNPLRRSNIER